MKKHRKLKLFFSPHLWSFLCILFAHSILWGQIEERSMDLSTNFECREKLYNFRLNGNVYRDRDKAFICPNSLPDTIEVIDLAGNPIVYNVTWTNASSISSINYAAKIQISDFINDKVEVFAEFADSSNVDYQIKLKVQNPELEFKDLNSAIYSFDENEIMQYSSYNTTPIAGIPWKFIEAGGTIDRVKAKTSPNAGFYAIDIQSTTGNLTIQPPNLISSNQQVELSHPILSSTNTTEIDVIGCAGNPELKVFVGNKIQKTVNFVYVCDSINGCPPSINETLLLQEANDVLNQSGHYLVLGAGNPYRDTIPYDVNNDGTLCLNEQRTTHQYFLTNPTIFGSDYLIMVADDLGEYSQSDGSTAKVIGRATSLNFDNSLAIDANDISSGSTIAHEIGHGCYGLLHPKNLTPPVTNDKENFMYFTSVGRGDKIRAYQFQLIHQIR